MDIPHMVTMPDTAQDGRDSVINLYPHHTVMAEVNIVMNNKKLRQKRTALSNLADSGAGCSNKFLFATQR